MPEDRRETPERREESIGVQIQHLEDVIEGVSIEIKATRKAAEQAVDHLGKRVSLVEVNVRALEDWRLSQKVLATEREQVAQRVSERAEQVEEQRHEDRREDMRQRVSRLQFWCGVAITTLAAILGALISNGTIF